MCKLLQTGRQIEGPPFRPMSNVMGAHNHTWNSGCAIFCLKPLSCNCSRKNTECGYLQDMK